MPFPPMPIPPEAPVIPYPISVRVKDTPSGSYTSDAKIFGVNETDGGYNIPSSKSASDGSIVIDCANMSKWTTTDNDLIHLEINKGYRNSVIFEKISQATRTLRMIIYPLSAELREEFAEKIGIIGSAIIGRRIIGRDKS